MRIDQPGVAPDGLTVDDEGGIWVALWNGEAIHRYAPDGSLLASVQLPVDRPTSCAFGGPRRDTLFVTTARTDLDDDALARQPHAGKVFAIDGLGARALPCLPCRAGHHGHLSVRARWRGPAQATDLGLLAVESAVMTPRPGSYGRDPSGLVGELSTRSEAFRTPAGRA